MRRIHRLTKILLRMHGPLPDGQRCLRLGKFPLTADVVGELQRLLVSSEGWHLSSVVVHCRVERLLPTIVTRPIVKQGTSRGSSY